MLFTARALTTVLYLCSLFFFVTGPMINWSYQWSLAEFRRDLQSADLSARRLYWSLSNWNAEMINCVLWFFLSGSLLSRPNESLLVQMRLTNPKEISKRILKTKISIPNRWSSSMAALQQRMEYAKLHLDTRVNRLYRLQAPIREPHLGRRRVLRAKAPGDRQIGRIQRSWLYQNRAHLVFDFHFWSALLFAFQRYVQPKSSRRLFIDFRSLDRTPSRWTHNLSLFSNVQVWRAAERWSG